MAISKERLTPCGRWRIDLKRGRWAQAVKVKDNIVECIKRQPTADVVEVVRCKECAHYVDIDSFVYDGKKAKHCVWHSDLRYDNDYCSDGIRREK